jgi:D-alanyl-D-alanine carboxypeptidase
MTNLLKTGSLLFLTLVLLGGCGSDTNSSRSSAVRETPVPATAADPTPSTATQSSESTPPSTEVQPIDFTVPGPLNQSTLDSIVARYAKAFPDAPAIGVRATSPSRKIDIESVAGVLDRTTTSPTPQNATYRIASITKTFTAATILRLHEKGELDLDANLAEAGVSKEHLALLEADNYNVDAITVRLLLQHTSGINDYVESSPKYVETVFADPQHKWTRTEQLKFAMDNGDPLSEPGAQYSYSDTGYILLGEIIEARTKQSYAAAMRSLLRFDSLGLQSTYLETVESPPATAGPRIVQYFGDVSVNEISATVDLFGGGGLVSSTQDLNIFFGALLGGKVFDKPETLNTMLETSDPEYGLGIDRSSIADTECFRHGGLWGVGTVVCPALDVSVSIYMTNATSPARDRMFDVVTAVVTSAGR